MPGRISTSSPGGMTAVCKERPASGDLMSLPAGGALGEELSWV